ncbi:MAG: hypothetical protein ACR2RV_15875 [Verrucomicrobiales bacterium]
MLKKCRGRSLKFEISPTSRPPYSVSDPEIEILDDMSARLTATFDGPDGSEVIGRAWISDSDGTMVDGETGVLRAGVRAAVLLTISEPKTQNGNLIACMRVEWPLYQTKHVIQCTLIKGEIVHPPKGKQC